VLFFKCMIALLSPVYRRGEGFKWGLVSYTVVMFSLATTITAMNLDIESMSYVDNRNFPAGTGRGLMGPIGYISSIYLKAVNVVPDVSYVVSGWLADGFLVSSLFDAMFTPGCLMPIHSALSLLRDPFHEPLGHRLPLSHVPQLCECNLNFLRMSVTLKANVDKIAMGVLLVISSWNSVNVPIIPLFSISVSLNVTLTLMIVLRLVLHGRCVRAATGSRAGIGGLYKTIATMFIESCALFAVSSLFAVGSFAAGSGEISSLAFPILTEVQVRTSPHPQLSDGLSCLTMEWADHCSTAHDSTNRQQVRIDEHHHPRKRQFVQS